MSNLNSFDLLSNHKRLQDLADKYGLKGSVKFSVDVWKYDHIEEIKVFYNCSYVDMNYDDPISESVTSEDIEDSFRIIENVFKSDLKPKSLKLNEHSQ